MSKIDWVEEFPGAITLCDQNGMILEMNQQAVNTFIKDGGEPLIGKNVLDCHPEPSRSKLLELINQKKSNFYVVEKKGKKKLIIQSPWYRDGEYAGILEIGIPLTDEIRNVLRE